MNQYSDSATLSQVKTSLTKNQMAAIDRLLIQHPTISPMDVRSHYEHYYYARNWFVWIEIETGNCKPVNTITRCDHSWTAGAKAKAIRAYIASKQGGQS